MFTIKNKAALYKVVSLLMIFFLACLMITFYYQATFTRYHADDYCGSARISSQGISHWFIDRYVNKSPRYTDIVYVGIVDAFGLTGIRFAPIVTLTIWLISMVWLNKELRRVLGLKSLPAVFDYVLAGLFVSISVYAAPNRFQTLFWRAGSVHHFVPIVFLTFLLSFLLRQDTNFRITPPNWRTFLFVFLFSFLTVGFSEPPATVMIAGAVISIGLLLYYSGLDKHRSMLLMVSYVLAGTVIGFLVMFFAPGKAFRLSTTPTVDIFLLRTLRFPLEFLLDTIRVSPIPTIFLFGVSVVFFFFTFQVYSPPILRAGSVVVRILIVLLAMYILIAASFAPSAYAQSYPIARARFLGYLFFNANLVVSGGLLGIWLANIMQFSWNTLIGTVLLFLSTVYLVRIASVVLAETSENRSWALAWDMRDAEIRSLKSRGIMDLTVAPLPNISGVGELSHQPTFINNCAAHFYGVSSIITNP
ncbi:MAG: hypothetical protein QM730_11735 [Anaerolineales bacterium]